MTVCPATEDRLLDRLTPRTDALVETVQAWSAINSYSWNADGLARMADVLRDAFRVLPGTCWLEDPEPTTEVTAKGTRRTLQHGRILRVSVRPQARRRVLLAGHMDTVFPPDSGFLEPQFLKPGVLNGPGCTDMKGGLLVMLEALSVLEASPWAADLGYEVIINADEEVSSLGSVGVLTRTAQQVDLGLVYEPALPDGTLAGARKGIGSFSVIAAGKSAHAGRNPQDGRNAVLAISDLFVRAARLSGGRPGLTVNVARIDGGGPTNVVPASAVGRFEVRVASHEDALWAQAELDALVAQVAGEHDLALELVGHFHRPPKPLDARQATLFAAIKACGADLGLPIAWAPTGGCCDGNNLAAAGLAVVDTLGVRGGAIHSSDEFLITESLVERARLSALFLLRMAQGAIPITRAGPTSTAEVAA
jgi:glutamate carboxypeptidase